jgi:hypothetical protein
MRLHKAGRKGTRDALEQMASAEHVKRQIAAAVVIAVEEPTATAG